MRFLVDAQLPPALARALSAAGHLAEHVTDVGPGDAPDRELWRYATENDSLLVTKDADFADLVALDDKGPLWSGYGSAILGGVS